MNQIEIFEKVMQDSINVKDTINLAFEEGEQKANKDLVITLTNLYQEISGYKYFNKQYIPIKKWNDNIDEIKTKIKQIVQSLKEMKGGKK